MVNCAKRTFRGNIIKNSSVTYVNAGEVLHYNGQEKMAREHCTNKYSMCFDKVNLCVSNTVACTEL
jgi:hypothetical protein